MLAAHEEKETLSVLVNIPTHDERVTTPLFERTKKLLIEREEGRCYLSGKTEAEIGPLEAHHCPIERSMTEMIDWEDFADDCKKGKWGEHAQAFDWDKFFEGATTRIVTAWTDPVDGHAHPGFTQLRPVDPYQFVDDMTVNGMLLAKAYHTGKDEGIHTMPYPLWIAQKYGIRGYPFAPGRVIDRSPKK